MNFNALIAVLILKNVITEDEGQRLVEHLNDKPQSTVLKDAVAAVAEIIGKPQAAIIPQLGPVGPAQHAEEIAARTATTAPLLEEPQLAAHDPVLDADQAITEDKSATDESTKTTSVKKSTDKPAKK